VELLQLALDGAYEGYGRVSVGQPAVGQNVVGANARRVRRRPSRCLPQGSVEGAGAEGTQDSRDWLTRGLPGAPGTC